MTKLILRKSNTSFSTRKAKKAKLEKEKKRKFMRYLRIALRGGDVHPMVEDCFFEIQEEVQEEVQEELLPENTVTLSGRISRAPERFSEMIFLKASNNQYCRGRSIDTVDRSSSRI